MMIKQYIQAWYTEHYYQKCIKAYPLKKRGTVLLYPGLAAGPLSMRGIRKVLEHSGYKVHDWSVGINRGLKPGVLQEVLDHLLQQLAQQEKSTPITLIGWSLGGLIAKLLCVLEQRPVEAFDFLWEQHPRAKDLAVALQSMSPLKLGLVTLGSPLNSIPNNEVVLHLYKLMHGKGHQRDEYWRSQLYEGVGHPSVSIYSKADPVVPWGCSVQLPRYSKGLYQNICLEGLTHWDLVKKSQSHYHLLEALEHIEGAHESGINKSNAYWSVQQSAAESVWIEEWTHYVECQKERYAAPLKGIETAGLASAAIKD